MKKSNYITILLTIGLAWFNWGFSPGNLIWEKMHLGLPESEVNHILINPWKPSGIFIGTARAVYRSDKEGKEFHRVLNLQGSTRGVNFLYIRDEDPNRIYAATDVGLFLSSDQGDNWQRIFYSSDPNEGQCNAVLSKRENVYLATQKGFFYKKTNEAVWQKEMTAFNDKATYFITEDEKHLYIATNDEVFRLQTSDNTIQKVFTLSTQEIEGNADFPIEPAESQYLPQIKSLSVVSHPKPVIYLAASDRIYFSDDQGESWQHLHQVGLPQKNITSLTVVNEQEIWVGSEKGIFRYTSGRWDQVYQGMETNNVYYLAHDKEGGVYAATDKGIYFLANEKALPSETFSAVKELSNPLLGNGISEYQEIDKYFEGEPSIQEIQKIAIEYAEVHPSKIKEWRMAAKRRAWLPTLSAGLDRSASELFHWDTGANPDNLRRGRDFLDWDVSLSWHLEDLVWNNDQTSIDSRSKLMVELREDILDQITRLFFERRRLQIDLLTNPAMEPPIKIEKQMRVAELTAMIDAFTGGQFSRLIKISKIEND